MKQNMVIIATALAVEYKAILSYLSHIEEIVHSTGTIYDVGEFRASTSNCRVAVVQTDQGNPRAALEVERAVRFFEPSHAFFVGVAGGLKDVQLGDIVAGTKIYGYESGKAEDQFKPRSDFGESTYRMVQRAKAVSRNDEWVMRIPSNTTESRNTPRAFVGPIAAGEVVVASTRSATYQFLRHNYSDALAVEMEGLGFLRVAYANPNLEALVVRGISDLIDKKSEADSSGSQEQASIHAAAFTFEVLAQILSQVATPLKVEQDIHDDDWWTRFTDLASTLYPLGPIEREVWVRAGGNIAELNLQGAGKEKWYAAMRILRLGGGGPAISMQRLIETMQKDFPSNSILLTL